MSMTMNSGNAMSTSLADTMASDDVASRAASYRMPGVSARAQLIRFDAAGIAVSAGSACSSGTLRTSPVLAAMGWDDKSAGEVVRVSFGWSTTGQHVAAFIDQWRRMAHF